MFFALLSALPAAPTLAQPRTGDIELIDAGAAPTRSLRHRFTAGQRQRLRLRVHTELRIQMGAREQTVPVPIMRLDLALGPTQLTDNGHLRYAFRVTDVGIDGEADERILEQVRAQMQDLVGLHGMAEVDDRGTIISFEFELPADASPQLRNQSGMLRQSLTQLLPRFPEEPVGVGAEWRIRDQLSLPQLSVEVATTYRLTRWDGDRIELSISTSTLEGGTQPEGGALTVSGTGSIRFELGSLRMRGRIQTVAAFETEGGAGAAMRMRVRTRTQISAR